MLKLGIYQVVTFNLSHERCPFRDWLRSLDIQTQARIWDRVKRLEKGQFGDYKTIDQSLYELRFFFGPGYRVYFGERKGKIILLLTGGDKSSQSRDIRTAKQYWKIVQEDNL